MNTRLPIKTNARAGMTLIELMIAIAIGMIVMAAVGTLMVFTVRSFVALGNYNDLDQASRNALDTMSRDIRQTEAVTFYNPINPTRIGFRDKSGTNNNLLFIWNASARTLTRYEAGVPKVLLEQCDYLRFGVSQRNPSNNFSFFPTTAGLNTAKLVDVSWRCSRQILQQKVNTESVQTAKIVVRN